MPLVAPKPAAPGAQLADTEIADVAGVKIAVMRMHERPVAVCRGVIAPRAGAGIAMQEGPWRGMRPGAGQHQPPVRPHHSGRRRPASFMLVLAATMRAAAMLAATLLATSVLAAAMLAAPVLAGRVLAVRVLATFFVVGAAGFMALAVSGFTSQ